MKNEIDHTSMKIFLSTAETRSFTATAGALHFSQQAVSKSIKALEDNLGTALFIRGRKSLELTPAGVYYAESCRHYLDQYSAIEGRIAEEAKSMEDRLCISFSSRLSLQEDLIDAMLDFRAKTPGLKLSAIQGDVMNSLVSDEADLALLLTETPIFEKDMYTRELSTIKEFIAVSPLVGEARHAVQVPPDIWGVPYLVDLPSQSSQTEAIFSARRRLRRWSLSPSEIEVLPNVHSVVSTLCVRPSFMISLDRFGILEPSRDIIRFPLSETASPLRLCCVWKRSSENVHILPLVNHLQKLFSS